ncbi:MAG: carbamoyl-phosphate synthase [Pseudomonadota bacterium]
MVDAGRPGVLLTESTYLGTLAAVRSYGRAGIPCAVAYDSHLGAAGWSRFASRRLKCPSYSSSGEMLRWLLAFGEANPGHVLYATSDDSAWLYSRHKDELKRYFRMFQPDLQAVYGLLNKQRLVEVARLEGLEFPKTWFPRSEADVRQIAASAQFPVLFKPVTQVLHGSHGKGVVVERAEDLAKWYAALAHQPHGEELVALDPDVTHPLVQEFQPEAKEGIYSISGFIDEDAVLLGARAAVKILQRPRRVGVGVCFEHAELQPELMAAIVRVCRRIGFYGVFEVEFIRNGDKYLMIDFNPRFYGQMAFDIARGLQLPLLAYYSALGQHERVLELAEAARQPTRPTTLMVHCNRIEFEIMVVAQRIARGLSSGEVAAWRSWYQQNRSRMVDPVLARDDRRPFVVELARHLRDMALHPRSFLKSTMASLLVWNLQLSTLLGDLPTDPV